MSHHAKVGVTRADLAKLARLSKLDRTAYQATCWRLYLAVHRQGSIGNSPEKKAKST